MKFIGESNTEILIAYSKFLQAVENPQAVSSNDLYRGSKYAPLDYSLSKLREIAATCGLGIMQQPGDMEYRNTMPHVTVCTVLIHESGQAVELAKVEVPAWQLKKDGSTRVDAQTIGAAFTYARRYSLEMACGVASDKDDDGNSLVQGEPQQNYQQAPQQGYQQSYQQTPQKRPSANNKASVKQMGYLDDMLKKVYGDATSGFESVKQTLGFAQTKEQITAAQATHIITKLKSGELNNGN